jgi:hypothetical protein
VHRSQAYSTEKSRSRDWGDLASSGVEANGKKNHTRFLLPLRVAFLAAEAGEIVIRITEWLTHVVGRTEVASLHSLQLSDGGGIERRPEAVAQDSEDPFLPRGLKDPALALLLEVGSSGTSSKNSPTLHLK